MIQALVAFGALLGGAILITKHQDLLEGGYADKYKPSDFSQTQLRHGTAVELEHTNSRALAREIAMDHLAEDPRYYIELKKMEQRLKKTRRH